MFTALMSLALLGVVVAGAIYYATTMDRMLAQTPEREAQRNQPSN